MHECLKQLLMSLLRAYRFSPIIPDLGLQVSCTSESPGICDKPASVMSPCPKIHNVLDFAVV